MNKLQLIAPALAIAAVAAAAPVAFADTSMMPSMSTSASASMNTSMNSMNTSVSGSGSTGTMMNSGSMTNTASMSSSMMAQSNLSFGSRGADVVSLQTWLETNGYLTIPAGTAKGYFGAATRAALKKYQAAAGVVATGYYGSLTRAALSSKLGMTSSTGSTSNTSSTNGVMVGGALMTPDRDIVQNALNANNVTTLVAAVKAAGLVSTLEGTGPFTVFAPTNDAFAKLASGTVSTLLLPQNKAQLTDILTYHVVAGHYTSADLYDGEMLTTVEGKKLTINKSASGQITVNGSAMVQTADVISSNGVTFVIDTVLMPK